MNGALHKTRSKGGLGTTERWGKGGVGAEGDLGRVDYRDPLAWAGARSC